MQYAINTESKNDSKMYFQASKLPCYMEYIKVL